MYKIICLINDSFNLKLINEKMFDQKNISPHDLT